MTPNAIHQLPWATPRLALGAGLLAAAQPALFKALHSPLSPIRTRHRLRPFPESKGSVESSPLTLFPLPDGNARTAD